MKNSTYATLPGYASTHHCPKAAVFLLLFSIFSLSAFAQTAPPPIEVRLQPGETAIRQISVTNPDATLVNYQTAVKETTASLARRTVAPTSFDGLEVVLSIGFEDYAVGDLGSQQGWEDRKTTPYEKYYIGNTIPVEASISSVDPFNGEKHLVFESVDTAEVYLSFSPQAESEQTNPIRSAVFYINVPSDGTEFELLTYDRVPQVYRRPPEIGTPVYITPSGWVHYNNYNSNLGYHLRTGTSYILDSGYVEVRYVVNRVTKTFDVYFDGRRVVESAKFIGTGEVDGIAMRGYNNIRQRFSTPTGPSMYLDDLTIVEGDASTPEWISTSTASGMLPAQGSSTLDVALNAQGLAPGTYEAEVQVLDEAFGTVSSVPVTLIVEEPPVAVVEKLNLTSMCSNDPDTLLRWRIRNPNDFAVDVTWQVYGSTQSATVSAPAGDSFFFTQTEAGANTTIIRWKDEEGRNRQKIKASGKAACDPANARVASNPKLKVYPTPVSDQLNVAVEGTTGGALSIYDQTGRVVYRGSISPDSPLQLNAQALQLQPRRIYVVSVQTPTQRVVRKIMIE